MPTMYPRIDSPREYERGSPPWWEGPVVKVRVMGKCVEQGSTKSFYIKKLNRVVTTHSNKNTEKWREDIRHEAKIIQEQTDFYTSDQNTCYRIRLLFLIEKPKSAPKRLRRAMKRPDLDKYIRAVLDALKDVLITDDARVIEIIAGKEFADDNEPPGAIIYVEKESGLWSKIT
jgi:Holliday junction resolvase RusA-like endonuclease